MAAYQAKADKSLVFSVSHGSALIGKLIYKNWYKFDATIDLANHAHYQIVAKGFWGTTIELKDQGNVLLKFSMSWNGDIVIQTNFDQLEKEYVFKHRGLLNESFILLDQEDAELMQMKPHIKWSSMNYEYQLETTERFESMPNKALLLLTAVHSANYYMSMASGTGSGF